MDENSRFIGYLISVDDKWRCLEIAFIRFPEIVFESVGGVFISGNLHMDEATKTYWIEWGLTGDIMWHMYIYIYITNPGHIWPGEIDILIPWKSLFTERRIVTQCLITSLVILDC